MTISATSKAANDEISTAQAWLVADQYVHGEWGRCERADPTADPRNLDVSRIKPNLFTSSQAALALRATGFAQEGPTTRFFDWLYRLRRQDSGFWTSASGAEIPMGLPRGWSEVKNIRHTAKALDLLLLRDGFTAGDAPVLSEVLATQGRDGSFPQHPGGASDLWSTAYAMNLLIRAKSDDHISKSIPRQSSKEAWRLTLTNHLERARGWLCDQVSGALWRVAGKDPVWISEAVLAEVGADLSLHRPDVSSQVANAILESSATRRGLTNWAMLLVLQSLPPDLQKQVNQALSLWSHIEIVDNTYDMACSVRAFWLKDDPQLTSYLAKCTGGHESLMANWSPWDRSQYLRWCVGRVHEGPPPKSEPNRMVPSDKSDAWNFAVGLLHQFKHQVEQRGMWRLLTDEAGTLRDESAIQTAFWNVASPLAHDKGVLIREPATGRGPVDFQFCNGSRAKVLMEFKKGGSAKPVQGLERQLPIYMDAEGADSAILIYVGNTEDHKIVYAKVQAAVTTMRAACPEKFLSSIYVDASKRASASTVK